MRLYIKRMDSEGRCRSCGKPSDNLPNVYCLSCKERMLNKRRQKKIEVYNAYGGKCACCGETTVEFLSLDHVNNDGAEHRRELRRTHKVFRHNPKPKKTKVIGNDTILRLIKEQNYPPTFQVLCMNCNFAKGKFGECPHERLRREASAAAST